MSEVRQDLEAGLSGQYTLEREIGRGGMATVWLARDLKHQRPVALKVLLPELAQSLGPERFRREIATAARLQHPHILSVHDSGEAGGQLWFTMPYVHGESLRERIRREGRLAVDEALRITREAAQALAYAHAEGVVHRDIKPENILITRDGSTLVADFGVARALGTEERGDNLTQTGSAIGTPTYMAPEQATGDRGIDGRADQYALAAVCYEMLVGEPPFTGANVAQLMAARFSTPVPDAQQKRAEVPPRVASALRSALALKPDDRYADLPEFMRALTGSQSGFTPVHSQTLTSPVVVKSKRGRYVGLAVLALAAAVAVTLIMRGRTGGVAVAASPADAPGVTRLAVLPFENQGDSADAYFAEGVSDAVRGKLAGVHGMQVTARTSSVQYRHAGKSLQDIGRELGVAYLLTGTVSWSKSGGTSRVRVNPELVEVSTGSSKWGQPFDAALTDVFQVQADIAGKVASALNVALGSKERTDIAERPTENLAAYDAFLRGEAVSQGLSVNDPQSLRAAVGYYRQALALDSSFALAWTQITRAHAMLHFYGTSAPEEAAAAQDALRRAQGLAPSRAATLLAAGQFDGMVKRDWAGALDIYEQALQLAPANPDLLSAAARAELSLGRWESALNHLESAQQLDPRSVATLDNLTRTLVFLERWPEARAAADRALIVAPATPQVIEWKAMSYLGEGDLAGAQRVLREAERVLDPTPLSAFIANYNDLFWVLEKPRQELVVTLPVSAFDGDRATWAMVRAQIYRLWGDSTHMRAYADTAAREFEAQSRAAPQDGQAPAIRALALAYLGRKAEAIAEAERAIRLVPLGRDAYIGAYMQHMYVRTLIAANETGRAVQELDKLLRIPYFISRPYVRIDPGYERLRGNPAFERLMSGS